MNAFLLKVTQDNQNMVVVLPAEAFETDTVNVINNLTSIEFGARFVNCTVRIGHTRTILMSPDLAEQLLVVPEIPYEIRLSKSKLIIGPVIGLYVSKKHGNIGPSRLRNYLIYLRFYELINGLIFIFALDGINADEQKIRGYYYCPREGEDSWQEGWLPYPGVIYKRIDFPKSIEGQLTQVMGDRIFNSPFFNKCDLWNWFSGDPVLGQYLPKTILVEDMAQFLDFISGYQKVYLKPVGGSMGKRVALLETHNQFFKICYRKLGANCEESFQSLDKLMIFLKKFYHNRPFLVQHALELVTFNGSTVDFRVIVQRDDSGFWRLTTIIPRVGASGSVVNNISSGGNTVPFNKLMELLGFNPESSFRLYQRIKKLAINFALTLPSFGVHCGDLGIDIGLDGRNLLWLIEINNVMPDHTIILDLGDRESYYMSKVMPLKYAKHLCGLGQLGGVECPFVLSRGNQTL